MKSTLKKLKCTANIKILRRGPNTTYIPLIRIGGNANFRFGVGGNGNFRVNINMLVYPTQNFLVRGITQREAPTQGILHCSGI